MPDVCTIFADGLLDASVTHGVARLTLAQTGPDGKPMAVGQLVMPQTNGVIERLFRTLKEQVVHGRIFQTIDEVRNAVRAFVV
jgi:hypothetical protein